MKFSDIKRDSVIYISAMKNNTSVTLASNVLHVTDEAVYVEPFMHGKSIINFKSSEIALEMLSVYPGDIPLLWPGVTVYKGEYEGQTCHIIKAATEGVKRNRRSSFRVFVGSGATLTEQDTGNANTVIVKDISATGLSFLVKSGPDAYEYETGKLVSIAYTDNEQRFIVDADLRIVRKTESPKGFVYGCKFTKLYPQIGGYVATKQIKNRNKNYPV